ncbi:MAG TPA: TetR/AcrR family transcriptional regulator [Acidisarcina sp.]
MTSATIALPRERYKSEVRAQILTGARQIFVHEGYASFSLRKLAAQIGYSPAAIYKHFKSKSEIFDTLAEESFAALTRASSSVKPIDGEDPVDRLKRGIWAYVNFGLDNPDDYRFAFLLTPPGADKPPKPRAAYSGLRDRVQKCIEAGRFASGDPELMAQSLWAAAHGVTSLLVQKPAFPWVGKRRLITRVIDSAVGGLLFENQ